LPGERGEIPCIATNFNFRGMIDTYLNRAVTRTAAAGNGGAARTRLGVQRINQKK
jgi:hypothetical protein